MPITLFLADDHQILRQGLRALLEVEKDFKLIGEAGDGLETLRRVIRLKPDVLVVDLMMPGLNGLDVARELKRKSPGTRIVVLTMHADEAYVAEALRAGATAYVLKEAGSGDLLKAIRKAALGQRYLSPPLSEEALAAYLQKPESAADPYDSLTSREREVLHLTTEGHSGNEISGRLFISRRTVESHRANLMRKLGVRNLKQLIRYALQRRPLPPPA